MKIVAENFFWHGDASVRIHLTEAETKALGAVGLAAGYLTLDDILHGIIDDAIGFGCRILRKEEDARFEREAQGLQAAKAAC